MHILPINLISEYREKLSAEYRNVFPNINEKSHWLEVFIEEYDKAIKILRKYSEDGIAHKLLDIEEED